MTEWIIDLIVRGGYWGIAFLMFIENIFPPIPSEVILGLGGFAVARGQMEFWPLLVVGTIGATLGNYAWFLAGDKLGYERLRPFVDRWARWLTMDWSDVEKASAFFRRHGHWVIFALRLSPFLRTMISLPAGLAHMGHAKFLIFTFAGAAIWNAALIKGGSFLANYFDEAQIWLNWVVIGSFLIAAGAYLWRVVTSTPRA